jgi:hypothetical protein
METSKAGFALGISRLALKRFADCLSWPFAFWLVSLG